MRFSRDNNPRPERLPGNGLGNRTAQKPPETPIKRPEQTQILNPNRVGCSASFSRTKLGQVQKLCMRVTAHFPPQTARPFQNTPQRQTSTHQKKSTGENKHPRHRPRPRRLLVDTSEEKLDQAFRGYQRVLTPYGEDGCQDGIGG